MLRLSVPILLLCFTLFAAEDATFTGASRNGRWWIDANEASKMGFLVGFVDAMVAYQRVPVEEFCNVPLREIMKGVDQVYSNSENTPIPISMAMHAYCSKVQGQPPADVERFLELSRQIAKEGSKKKENEKLK